MRRRHIFYFFPFILMILILCEGISLAKEQKKIIKPSTIRNKTSGNVNGYYSMINIGNFGYWLMHTGISAHNPHRESGGIYPLKTASVIYVDGLLWGGLVRENDPQKPQLRVGGNTYTNGTQPGWWGGDPNDERARIYRIRMDWQHLTSNDVMLDAAELYNVSIDQVTPQMASEVIAQYRKDWKEWPVDLGAPYYDVNKNGVYDPLLDEDGMPIIAQFDNNGNLIAGGDYPGLAQADQVLWFVVNDDNPGRTGDFSGSPPMGIELQTTVWAYGQPTYGLGQIVFKRYKIINRSAFVIDSLYFSQFSDPDLGAFRNDLVGCDTTRSMMFGYNAYRKDAFFEKFNLPPAAVGYDLLQGPIVPSPGDTAVFNFLKLPDYKNLPMTSFNYHPVTFSEEISSNYAWTLMWYSAMQGFLPTIDLSDLRPMTVQTGPHAGQPTKFPLSGDPTTETSETADLDGYVEAPGDRRMLLSCGPITMQPGDEQEIVVAVVGGLGGDNLESLRMAQTNDLIAQVAYNNLFKVIPKPPDTPKVKTAALEDKIVLDWGWNEEAVKRTEAKYGFYDFEGYNIYQLPSPLAQKGDEGVILLATFDKINGVLVIENTFYSPEYKKLVTLPVQYGDDTGLKRYFIVEKDYINDLPLYRGSTYYFAVSAYNYNEQFINDRSLESALSIVTITPQNPRPGYEYNGHLEKKLDVTREGSSDGSVQVLVIDPTATTGHDYEIFFHEDKDTSSATFGETFWGLYDKTTADTITKFQKQHKDLLNEDALTFDGLLIKVATPSLSMKSFQVIANGNGPLDPPASAAADWQGFPVPDPYYNIWPNMANRSFWFIHTLPNGNRASFDAFMEQTFQYTGGLGNPGVEGIHHLIPHDFEIRFTGDGKAFDSWNTRTVIEVPFELWDIGDDADPGDDYKLVPYIYDYDNNGRFNLMYDAADPNADPGWADHEVSPYANDPWSDSFYWIHPTNNTAGTEGFDKMIAALQNDPDGAVPWWAPAGYANGDYDGWAGMHRMVLVNWNGGDVTTATSPADYNAELPDIGAVFRLVTTKPNTPDNKYYFTAPAVTYSTEKAQVDVAKINVFPNPYYANNPQESNHLNHFVTFNHLPGKAVFRIFNLAGVLIRKLEKNDDSQFFRWDLKNRNNIPVASGVYIVHIELPELGKIKILKVFIVQGVQVIENF
ncbi:MAG TPA: T9SS type A sorting domain-containing protein [Calditrichaeota bacterium]|nr:T9SS type A sorting domain-containing protein [Calditrichota bacterium]